MKAKALAVILPALFFAASAGAADKSTSKSSDTGMHTPSAQDRANNREAVSDTAITTKVKSALAADVGLKTMTNVHVETDNDGIVTLKGEVASADQKKHAGEVAKKVNGVKSVKNELRVASKK
jgi:hyperosmotically inducible protein